MVKLKPKISFSFYDLFSCETCFYNDLLFSFIFISLSGFSILLSHFRLFLLESIHVLVHQVIFQVLYFYYFISRNIKYTRNYWNGVLFWIKIALLVVNQFSYSYNYRRKFHFVLSTCIYSLLQFYHFPTTSSPHLYYFY